jgi:hypothetical protein
MILQEIPLIIAPNQTLSATVNGQTLNIAINTLYINDKLLIGKDADPDDKTTYKTFCSLSVGTNQIIYNNPAIHAQYINQYANNNFNGYLFFYVDGVNSGNDDTVSYKNFNSTTHLYYSDFDAVDLIYQNWVKANQNSLLMEFVYGGN